MNNDILPPRPRRSLESPVPQPQQKRPLGSLAPARRPQPVVITPEPPKPLVASDTTPGGQKVAPSTKKPRSLWKKILFWFILLVTVAIIAAAGSFAWYQTGLQSVSVDSKAARVRVTIESGAHPDAIASQLYDKKLIKNTLVFDIYTRLSGTRNKLQAGTFSLSPHESTQEIVAQLVSGKVDEFSLTFLPGSTIAEDKKVLINAGYTEGDVDAAFKKTYDSPIFASKPASADLEGYIYGETYNFSTSATPEEVLERTFAEFNTHLQSNHLVEAFSQKGLNLYQGITLASIIQREVSSKDANTPNTDQKQVAQVFYSRLAINLPLGSDITAYYGADQIGAEHSVKVDTPYNTRIHSGLPPGPIASPSLGSLLAVAYPAAGDYLFFLSGDDNMTYFSHTDAEHQKNIVDHCSVKCAIP